MGKYNETQDQTGSNRLDPVADQDSEGNKSYSIANTVAIQGVS